MPMFHHAKKAPRERLIIRRDEGARRKCALAFRESLASPNRSGEAEEVVVIPRCGCRDGGALMRIARRRGRCR
jgi:hypothetical protein